MLSFVPIRFPKRSQIHVKLVSVILCIIDGKNRKNDEKDDFLVAQAMRRYMRDIQWIFKGKIPKTDFGP